MIKRFLTEEYPMWAIIIGSFFGQLILRALMGN